MFLVEERPDHLFVIGAVAGCLLIKEFYLVPIEAKVVEFDEVKDRLPKFSQVARPMVVQDLWSS